VFQHPRCDDVTFSIGRWTILGLIGVVLLAGFLRFDGLGTPNTFIGDGPG